LSGGKELCCGGSDNEAKAFGVVGCGFVHCVGYLLWVAVIEGGPLLYVVFVVEALVDSS
jgi:hypothetical protein